MPLLLSAFLLLLLLTSHTPLINHLTPHIPSAIKLCLSGCTGFTIWALLWFSCLMDLGGHSAVGWLLTLLLTAWRVLLWRPAYWLQVRWREGGGGDMDGRRMCVYDRMIITTV